MFFEYFEWRLASRLPNPQRLNDDGNDQTRIVYRGERDKMSPARKAINQLTRHLHRKARLANPAWTRDRDQAHILTQQEFFGGRYFLLPPHKPGSLRRKVRRAGLRLVNRLLREAVAYGCEFPREISGGDVALVGFFRQAPLDRPTQWGRGVRILHSNRLGLLPQNGHQRLGRCVSLKGALSGHHLVKHQAERKLV